MILRLEGNQSVNRSFDNEQRRVIPVLKLRKGEGIEHSTRNLVDFTVTVDGAAFIQGLRMSALERDTDSSNMRPTILV